MEVHPPHEPVHSWRDALIHIGLMTVGLFIALMLEGVIEYLHHKELVLHARENIHVELQQNHQAVQTDLKDVTAEMHRLKKSIDTINSFRTNPKGHGSIDYKWNLTTPTDTAWRTARDTGAFGYMPYAEVQAYAGVYGLQSFVVGKFQQVQFREAEALAPLMAQPHDFESMLPADFNNMATLAATNYLANHLAIPASAGCPLPGRTQTAALTWGNSGWQQEIATRMEVHPPDHAIHNWRDFFIHIGTITIGLLIAIGLEGLVEHAHHRHLLHTAEDNLRDELRDNRALLAADQRSLLATQTHLEQMVAALDAAQAHKPGPPDPSLSWEWNGPQAAAWDTARNSGAASLMDYKQASGFALVYEQQRIVNEQAALYVRDLYSIGVTVQRDTALSSMSPATLASMASNTQHTLADLKLLRDYCRNLDHIYTSAESL